MRILLVHNHYGRYATGGEGHVMHAEAANLERHGHAVFQYERTNAEVEERGIFGRLKLLTDVAWSRDSLRSIGRVIDAHKPDVMHVHNYWFVLSPSIFAAATARGVATVLSLHNYRLICPGVLLLGPSGPCELCLRGGPWRVVWKRCYPGRSLLKSILSLRLYWSTKRRDFLTSMVHAYIALSGFAREKLIEGGLDGRKIHVKPNFLGDPLEGDAPSEPGHEAIFVGRISPEKGVRQLMEFWRTIPYPLAIIGDGPDLSAVKRMAPPQVRFLRVQPHSVVLRAIEGSAFMVFPSLCYETSPLTILEAMAMGRAVLASDLGPRRELVQDGKTGLLFKTGDGDDFRRQVSLLIENRELCKRLGLNGRQEYLDQYTPERNYQMLHTIYEKAMARGRHGAPDAELSSCQPG